jgi:hypothetical protein
LTEGQVLKRDRAVSAADQREGTERGRRERSCAAIDQRINQSLTIRILANDSLMGKKVDPSQLLPGVQADLWAMVTMVNLQSRGYVRVG